MKEKRREKHTKKEKHKTGKKRSTSSSSSESDKWVEKELIDRSNNRNNRDEWMSMTGMFKTYAKGDFKSKEAKNKNHIDSYNPGTSTRELNPYWKDGGTGVPQTSEEYRKSKPFMKPTDEDDYYSKSTTRYSESHNERSKTDRQSDSFSYKKSCNWKKETTKSSNKDEVKCHDKIEIKGSKQTQSHIQNSDIDNYGKPEIKGSKHAPNIQNTDIGKYLSDEKLNKLAAKIVKAEIMGDTKLVSELKTKLEAAREYRKHKLPPDEDDRVMLISTNTAGNSRPLTKSQGDPRSKGSKRKAETHISGERSKYFGNDDQYNLAQMFQNEKYGNNYDQEAQLAKIAAKHINPNDDLEDIFIDEISKNKDIAKDHERERQIAINEHNKIERSLEGCEYCIDSKNMIKHLMVSCGRKVYLALPSRRSLVKGQCIITTIQHHTCVTAIDEDVWEEILDFRRALTVFFDSQGKDVLFYETATRLHRYPHMVINCVPLPRDVGDSASIYFKKALLECEAEWSMNKKVVDLKGKNIRKGIPKGLPYFWIDFSMEPGFAHVIEDQKLFPKNFAEEVIGGILDLDHYLWKNPSKEYGDLQRKKVSEFLKEWKPFDTISVNPE